MNATLTIVFTVLFRVFFNPLFSAITTIVKVLIGAIVGIGELVGSVPKLIAGFLTGAFAQPVNAILLTIGQFNQEVARVAAEAGLAGPPVVLALGMLEVGLGMYAVWFAINAVDLPFINLGATLRLAFKPLKAVVSFVR